MLEVTAGLPGVNEGPARIQRIITVQLFCGRVKRGVVRGRWYLQCLSRPDRAALTSAREPYLKCLRLGTPKGRTVSLETEEEVSMMNPEWLSYRIMDFSEFPDFVHHVFRIAAHFHQFHLRMIHNGVVLNQASSLILLSS
jgi:predicted ester cyclase